MGIDLFDAVRLERELARDGPLFLAAVFTAAELAACGHGPDSVPRLAACFAGKEAIAKALALDGSRGMPWRQIEVLARGRGEPEVRLEAVPAQRARALGVTRIRVSLDHHDSRVVAIAIAEA